MEAVALLLLLVVAVLGITSLTCFVIVLVGMFKQSESLLLPLFSLLCCQIIVLIWGWTTWQSKYKWPVMGIWTAAILINLVLQVVIGALTSQQGGY